MFNIFLRFLMIMVVFACDALLGSDRFLNNVFTRWPSPTPWVQHRDAEFLDMLPHNAIVVEVGVQAGAFSNCILEKTRPKKLFLIDCWEYQSPLLYKGDNANVLNFEQEILFNSVLNRFSNEPSVVIIREYSKNATQLFLDESIDWIYIDANHGYEAVKEDINLWWPKIKKGGFLTGHDYILYPEFGVVQAVNEFLREQGLYFSILTTKDGFDSWAIQKTNK